MIDGATKLFGVLGQPLGHSLSPLMQNYYLRESGVNGAYFAWPVEAKDLAVALGGLKAIGVAGCNVTIPYKEAVIPYLVGLTKAAKYSGAVNTLIPQGKGFVGDNTDGQGLLAAMEAEHGWIAQNRRILVLGAGGAAKGIGVSLALAGAKEIIFANRNFNRAQDLAEALNDLGESHVSAVTVGDLGSRDLYKRVDSVINTTSLGMSPKVEGYPPIAIPYLDETHLVVDIVYNPLQTRLLQLAAAQGAKTCSGLGMFVHQGALAFERWLGIKPDSQGARELLVNHLEAKEKNGGEGQ